MFKQVIDLKQKYKHSWKEKKCFAEFKDNDWTCEFNNRSLARIKHFSKASPSK